MKTLTGKVVSTKMAKTIIVEVVRQNVHPLYKKIMHRSTRYKVHNEDSSVKEGDTVKIVSVRPISKDKHYKVIK
ncbi:30S ribosomal protein S17 [Candidatus Gottesmanbacteria bacterium]|nr:30S ribosomal protein S17 [Candidatus Gottesmanbacteria bacterium]MBI5452252.1 30S ribosomal protein S17 [Candidatus Gottesmanbacteria bacterium]